MTKKKPPDEKQKVGRRASYKPEYPQQAKKLCLLGATDDDLADFFDVSVRTIARWSVSYPEFCQAIKIGKEPADDRVERSLFHRANGYTFDSVKIFMPSGAQEPVYAPFREHVPPDTSAMIFWLKNRRKAEWRDKIDHELAGKDGGAIIQEIRRVIVRAEKGEEKG
jgi:hypothetical protein